MPTRHRDVVGPPGLWLLGFLAATIGGSGVTSGHAADPRPNVVLILTDDQGYGDLSCHGNPNTSNPTGTSTPTRRGFSA